MATEEFGFFVPSFDTLRMNGTQDDNSVSNDSLRTLILHQTHELALTHLHHGPIVDG
jgi:hypothetical protein